MADGVRVVDPRGDEKTYPLGASITRDGWGDYEIRDSAGAIVAVRPRASVQEIEVVST